MPPRALQSILFAMAASAALAAIGERLAGAILGPVPLAALGAAGGLLVTRLTGKTRAAGATRLAGVIGREVDHIMIDAAETSYFIASVKRKIEQDVRTTDTIVASSEHNARMMAQIAANAAQASSGACNARKRSVAGSAEAGQGLDQINDAHQDARAALAMMTALREKSRRIHGITEAINKISVQTDLLALNAAVEAARAGEHGRGFVIVAGEVRHLAQRTKSAAAEIGAMVREIGDQAERAAAGMQALSGKVTEAVSNVERVHAALSEIERGAVESQGGIERIAALSREHASATEVIAAAIAQIRNGMLSTEAELPLAADCALALAERAEALFVAATECDVETAHDANRAAAGAAAEAVGRLFEAAIARGEITREALFDRTYRPVPRTDPPKHTSRFDAFTDRVLPSLQEKILADMPHLVYAGAVNLDGYFPTHNKKFSQALTGDYDTDLANNRTKRIFDDRTGARCGSNRKPFLLQTYTRDTGEVMHDLSAPIHVEGKHWGGFRIGYRSGARAGPALPRAHAGAAPDGVVQTRVTHRV